MSFKEKCDKKYELVAPDGGWGYMIVIAGIINHTSCGTFISSFGLIYNDLIKEIGMESTGVTFLNGVFGMCFAIGGFITSPLLKIMNMRQLSFLAVVAYNLGTVSIMFVKSVPTFFLTAGVIQGTGFGILFNITYALLNQYFVKKRLFAYSISKTTIGLFAMVGPLFVKFTLSEYGFKGTILMMTAVSMQSFISVALMQPVAWHMKKVEKPAEEETQILLVDEKTVQITFKSNSNENSNELQESNSTEINIANDVTTGEEKSSWIVTILKGLFDVSLMKMFLLSNASWGIAASGAADMTFLSLVPQALYADGWSKNNVALALSLVGFGDMAGRGISAILSKWLLRFSCQHLFIIGLLVSVVARTGIICTSSVTVALVFMTIYGFGRCFLALFMPLVICEVSGNEKFTAAMGFAMIVLGAVNISSGPIFGAIRDYTKSYDITFGILAGILLTVSITWTIELVYKRRKQSNKIKK